MVQDVLRILGSHHGRLVAASGECIVKQRLQRTGNAVDEEAVVSEAPRPSVFLLPCES